MIPSASLNQELPNKTAITRLTALWALSESGLGGLMFALKIPLTGFFVGGFAVLLIGLIAWFGRRNFRTIVQATVLVLIVKATASPHSPPPAYIAVAFQGLLGALVYRYVGNFKIAAVLLAVIAMVESALQKVIMLTLVYGRSLWEALNKMFEGISKDFPVFSGVSFSLVIIGIYLLLYVIWGFVVGIFSGKLPVLLQQNTSGILHFYHEKKQGDPESPPLLKKKNKAWKWLSYAFILGFILAVFWFSGGNSDKKILYIVFRTVAAILLLFFVLRPVMNWLIQRWMRSQNSETKKSASEILALLPAIRSYVKPSWQFAAKEQRGWRRLRNFIVNLLVLTLHDTES